MLIVWYISSHGFGHASRQIEVINALVEQRSDAAVFVRSSAPRWLFDQTAHGVRSVETLETDTGVAQIDSLTIDEKETARRAAAFYADFESRVSREADTLDKLEASVVVGDAPPLAPAAAKRVGIPSVLIANFTWDWIYDATPQFHALAPGVVDSIREAYASTTLTLRLPMHGGFESISGQLRDIPLIARHASRPRAEIRRLLSLDSDQSIVLASFGGFGLRLPYGAIARRNRLTVVVTDYEMREKDTGRRSTLRRIDKEALTARELLYQDLVAASDVVVSKPGYGIVSECAANGTALLYTSRGRFAEYDVLTREMPRFLRCQFISQKDLCEGNWSEPVKSLLNQPLPASEIATNGAQIAAAAILEIAS